VRTWKLSVWTRYAAPVDEVWRLKTDVHFLADELGPWLRLRADDPNQLQQALRHTGGGVYSGRMAGPLGLVGLRWPLEVRSSEPLVAYCDSSSNLLYAHFEHRHLFQPTDDDHVRYVDEVVFTPALRPDRLWARLTERTFVRRHHRAARHLAVDPGVVGISVLRQLTRAEQARATGDPR